MKSGDEIADWLSNLLEDVLSKNVLRESSSVQRTLINSKTLRLGIAKRSVIVSSTMKPFNFRHTRFLVPQEKRQLGKCGYELRHIIWKVLKTRSEACPVHRLRLSWIQDDIPTWDVVGWISCLVGKEIKELDLCLKTTFQRRYRLPNCLFSCGTENLVCLKLKGFIVLDTTTNLFAFPSLKVLELINVLYTEEDSLSTILSSCTGYMKLNMHKGQIPVSDTLAFLLWTMESQRAIPTRPLSKSKRLQISTITPVYDFVCFLPYWERRREQRRQQQEVALAKGFESK
ncbi:putative f-box/fbd/lrr-repeat protein [Quercus suber]|uniref:F-box/fbd/lrr-repeat protein n=1 Tax=Quercus suber TaxID=58331 RepID=A0AAW0J7C6_QUESU